MNIHLVDGTYELFRHFFAVPLSKNDEGQEIGAVRAVVGSVLKMLEEGATHLGIATDHVIESFRNKLYPGYKTGYGINQDLLSQFVPLEEAMQALGVRVWPMIHQEADDALAAAAFKAAKDPRVEQVFICTPDKDLAQCVVDDRIVLLDRRKDTVRNEAGVWSKFGVGPSSIPDYLALVGDTADGFPGLPGWGAKGSSTILKVYPHLEEIPLDSRDWNVSVRNSKRMAQVLSEQIQEALLFRKLATLRTDVNVFSDVEELHWEGPTPGFRAICQTMNAVKFSERVQQLAAVKQQYKD